MKTAETISQALLQATTKLSRLPQANARFEAELLLARVLNRPRTYLFAWPELKLEVGLLVQFEELVKRRLQGEPSAYLTGHKEFWSLELKVTHDTLIPRPETELLVEQALQLIPPYATYRIADLGTGSGAISAALAIERPKCQILATDISPAALAVARENFALFGIENIRCSLGRWVTALVNEPKFDLIVSNPPYVARNDPHLADFELNWEPGSALISGADGLDDIREIVATADSSLMPGGWLLLEHGFSQGEQVRQLLSAAGYRHCQTHLDLGGRERVSQGQTPHT